MIEYTAGLYDAEIYKELRGIVENIEGRAYIRGFEDGRKNAKSDSDSIDTAYNAGYGDGAIDAWETAKSVLLMNENEKMQWFGTHDPIIDFEVEEAMDRWNNYTESVCKNETSWHDIPAEEMSMDQLRSAVKDLRMMVSELRKGTDK